MVAACKTVPILFERAFWLAIILCDKTLLMKTFLLINTFRTADVDVQLIDDHLQSCSFLQETNSHDLR